MKVRHNRIHFRRGQQSCASASSPSPNAVPFIGSVNGIDCGAWPTEEAAVQGLLRRAVSSLNH